ncbi:MAG: hypothetical protein IKM61_04460 [Eubacteriaceae bacterium]|nr:hypothetical protein [Eubacteriaceae bacterium]
MRRYASSYDSSLVVKADPAEENRTVFELCKNDSEGKERTVVLITTMQRDSEKYLQVSFPVGSGLPVSVLDEFNTSEAITPETAKDAFEFVSKLYGLKDKNVLYEVFSEEYGITNTEISAEDIYSIAYAWQSEIEGTSCKVLVREYDGIDRTNVISVIITPSNK